MFAGHEKEDVTTTPSDSKAAHGTWPTASEVRALRRIVTLRALTWCAFLLGVPVMLLASLLSRNGQIVAFVVWVAVVLVPATMLGWASCPRCRQFFFIPLRGDKYSSNTSLIAHQCANCGLPL